MESPPKSCPIIGHNSKGFANTHEGIRPVVVVQIDPVIGILHVCDIETHKLHTLHPSLFIMANSQIPPSYRQEAFNRVAAHWAAALNAYPSPVVINTGKMSFYHFARLLRNAREAKNRYSWTHPLIDENKWSSVASLITVTDSSDGVLLGPKESKFPPKGSTVGTLKPFASSDITCEWRSLEDLERLCFLLDQKLLTPVPAFIVSNLTPDIIESLEARYAVGFVQHETDKTKWSIV